MELIQTKSDTSWRAEQKDRYDTATHTHTHARTHTEKRINMTWDQFTALLRIYIYANNLPSFLDIQTYVLFIQSF